MRTKFCPHCGSENIHREEEAGGGHFHECDDCQEAWEHHPSKPLKGTHSDWDCYLKSNN